MSVLHIGNRLLLAFAIPLFFCASEVPWVRCERNLNLETMSLEELATIASDPSRNNDLRWQSTRELARRKDAWSIPILICLLQDDYQPVRGAAAWGLSQVGGEEAQNALLEYLRASVKSKTGPDLASATDAEKELPDKRAVDLLIRCLGDVGNPRYPFVRSYAAEALGKIGNPKASLPLAQQLNIEIDYVNSRDFWYMEAIRTTKGAGATPILVEYLERLVQKMAGQDLSHFTTNIGSEYRQTEHNFRMYKLTLAALEAVTGRKSLTGTREDVAKDWKESWKREHGKHTPRRAPPARSD